MRSSLWWRPKDLFWLKWHVHPIAFSATSCNKQWVPREPLYGAHTGISVMWELMRGLGGSLSWLMNKDPNMFGFPRNVVLTPSCRMWIKGTPNKWPIWNPKDGKPSNNMLIAVWFFTIVFSGVFMQHGNGLSRVKLGVYPSFSVWLTNINLSFPLFVAVRWIWGMMMVVLFKRVGNWWLPINFCLVGWISPVLVKRVHPMSSAKENWLVERPSTPMSLRNGSVMLWSKEIPGMKSTKNFMVMFWVLRVLGKERFVVVKRDNNMELIWSVCIVWRKPMWCSKLKNVFPMKRRRLLLVLTQVGWSPLGRDCISSMLPLVMDMCVIWSKP